MDHQTTIVLDDCGLLQSVHSWNTSCLSRSNSSYRAVTILSLDLDSHILVSKLRKPLSQVINLPLPGL